MASNLEHTMRELQEERDRVATLLHERRQLIASVSHELRTPVATLRSYFETTLTHWGERSTPITQRDLQEMEEEVIHLQLLIDDLFSLARSEVGKLELRCESTDVGQLVREVVEKGAPLVWQSSRIEMVADTPSEIVDVLVDPKRLEQVLRNLLHNAVRHTTPGGIVAVEVKVEPEAVLILVKDTGEGISPKDLPYIWERFYQTERSQTRMDGGAGLGLALVKEWIEEMGGTVSVESVVDRGKLFFAPFTSTTRIRWGNGINLFNVITTHYDKAAYLLTQVHPLGSYQTLLPDSLMQNLQRVAVLQSTSENLVAELQIQIRMQASVRG